MEKKNKKDVHDTWNMEEAYKNKIMEFVSTIIS